MLGHSILLPAYQVLTRGLHLQIIFAGIGDLVHGIPRPLKQLVKGLERSAGGILLSLLAMAEQKVYFNISYWHSNADINQPY